MILRLAYLAYLLSYAAKVVTSEDEGLYTETDTKNNAVLGNILTPPIDILPTSETTGAQGADVGENQIQVLDNTTLTPAPIVASSNETKKVISCKQRNSTVEEKYEVEMANSSRLIELLIADSEVISKETEAQCTIIMFFSRLCPFSAMAGPHFNALARSFPNIKMAAIDALTYHGFNTQYGIVGVPTLIIFHNGRPVAKFNGTEYTIHSFVKFINIYTGIKEEVIAVHSQDFQGPVPSITDKEMDYFLVLSWIFITVCSIFFFSKSFLWNVIIEKVKNIWREAEAQHDHID